MTIKEKLQKEQVNEIVKKIGKSLIEAGMKENKDAYISGISYKTMEFIEELSPIIIDNKKKTPEEKIIDSVKQSVSQIDMMIDGYNKELQKDDLQKEKHMKEKHMVEQQQQEGLKGLSLLSIKLQQEVERIKQNLKSVEERQRQVRTQEEIEKHEEKKEKFQKAPLAESFEKGRRAFAEGLSEFLLPDGWQEHLADMNKEPEKNHNRIAALKEALTSLGDISSTKFMSIIPDITPNNPSISTGRSIS